MDQEHTAQERAYTTTWQASDETSPFLKHCTIYRNVQTQESDQLGLPNFDEPLDLAEVAEIHLVLDHLTEPTGDAVLVFKDGSQGRIIGNRVPLLWAEIRSRLKSDRKASS